MSQNRVYGDPNKWDFITRQKGMDCGIVATYNLLKQKYTDAEIINQMNKVLSQQGLVLSGNTMEEKMVDFTNKIKSTILNIPDGKINTLQIPGFINW